MTQMKPSIIALLLSFAFLLAACTENLSSKSDDNNTESEGGVTPTLSEPGPGGDQLKFSLSGNVFIAEVDASGNDWVYVDLVNQQQVNPVNPDASDEWHLAHKGAEIKLNGGVSGAPSSGFSSAVYADKAAEGEGHGAKKVKNEFRVQSAKCRVQRKNRKRSDAEKRHGANDQ